MASVNQQGTEIRVIDYEDITVFIASKALKGPDLMREKYDTKQFEFICRSIAGSDSQHLGPHNFAIGEIVGVYLYNANTYTGDWVRGCVEQVDGLYYKLWLVDHNKLITTKQHFLCRLSTNFLSEWSPAIKKVGLYGVLPVGTLDLSSKFILTDFFHRGPIHFKAIMLIRGIWFGDITVKQLFDSKEISLTSHLLANRLVKEVDNFEQACQELISNLTKEREKAIFLQELSVCKLDEKVDSQVSQKSTPSIQASLPLENQGKERLNNSAGSNVVTSLDKNIGHSMGELSLKEEVSQIANKENLNIGSKSKSCERNSYAAKRIRIIEMCKKKMEEMSMNSETSGSDMSLSNNVDAPCSTEAPGTRPSDVAH